MIPYKIQILLSMAIRVFALIWSFALLQRIRDWRMALLTLMLTLMAIQQYLRLMEIRSELPGFFVSIMALVMTIFIGKLILNHQQDEEALRKSNEILEQRVQERTSELEKSNLELKELLAQVKTLKGMLPICSSCKKIRDDQGYWTQIESYIKEHSDAEFSHGICPDCLKKLYPEVAESMKSARDQNT